MEREVGGNDDVNEKSTKQKSKKKGREVEKQKEVRLETNEKNVCISAFGAFFLFFASWKETTERDDREERVFFIFFFLASSSSSQLLHVPRALLALADRQTDRQTNNG